jgi:hypothetical protein
VNRARHRASSPESSNNDAGASTLVTPRILPSRHDRGEPPASKDHQPVKQRRCWVDAPPIALSRPPVAAALTAHRSPARHRSATNPTLRPAPSAQPETKAPPASRAQQTTPGPQAVQHWSSARPPIAHWSSPTGPIGADQPPIAPIGSEQPPCRPDRLRPIRAGCVRPALQPGCRPWVVVSVDRSYPQAVRNSLARPAVIN